MRIGTLCLSEWGMAICGSALIVRTISPLSSWANDSLYHSLRRRQMSEKRCCDIERITVLPNRFGRVVARHRERRGWRLSGRFFRVLVPRSRNRVARIRSILVDPRLWSMMKFPSRFHRQDEILDCHHRRGQRLERQIVVGKVRRRGGYRRPFCI